MNTFKQMVDRIAGELLRSNIPDAIKNGINDAIDEAANTRFYFNEMRGATFVTVPGQEYYPDLGLVEIDAMYYVQGGTRYDMMLVSNTLMDDLADGNPTGGQLELFSRRGQELRMYPIPSQAYNVFVDGYGRLTPFPLAADSDTNEWLNTAERYIRNLAKANVFKDQIRDFGQATAYQALAEDAKATLEQATATRIGTGQVVPTQW